MLSSYPSEGPLASSALSLLTNHFTHICAFERIYIHIKNTLTHNQTHSKNCDVIWFVGFCGHRWQPRGKIKSENDVAAELARGIKTEEGGRLRH